ncbi:COG3942 and LysM peptidoglycan-binding domain-containing protein [Oenococcus oeni]|uniref:Cell wall-associated hydrolase with LysM domains n=17 Tax=Oenococcus oeni TaxID=1247 RepID=Q04E31_OENOB|nr:LysM peptidoglycan-binding domain-containing protein [Oenococcus oeni]ABJ57291.1 Cell wall-associated hydrolase with LysM domains [Oenococcus oeni PSU-1]OIK67656.1 peptidoglycan-binding protein [Oenococcus oeni]OIL13803.1 peptidoglycan-binding protein [Oenococcus oeni]OIL27455.1 peptidoglycan-binding protein [Oenococcus oeni]OIL81016.1 peptidoglycan-binding protein [Oenococcus oeni]
MTTKTVKNALLISTGAAAALAVGAVSANADTVTVKQGDSVWALAKEYDTSVSAIAKANKLSNPALILSGSSLNIPSSSSAATTTSETASSASTTAATSISAENADGTVTIASGDTLYGIAERYGVSVSTLIANNDGSTFIVAGQKLSLKATTTTSAATTTSSAAATTASPAVATTTSSAAVSSAASSVASSQAPVASSATSSVATSAPASTASSVASSQAPVASSATSSVATSAPASTASSVASSSYTSQASSSATSYSTRRTYPTTSTSSSSSTTSNSGVSSNYATTSSSTNTYTYGQCTWYVKNMLSWVPNGLGNAYQWASAAAAEGYTVNNTPTVGSVVVFQAGQAYAGSLGHVAVVTAVYGDGSIRISEGNYAGLATNTRTVTSASSYQYIHA